jgi:addiction module RelE/StbE family toxin
VPHTVILSPRALEDLNEIRRYIAKDNPERADTFIEELADVAQALSENGPRHAVVPRFELLKIRSVSYRRYLILYQIEGDTVGVLRIVHGARDLTNLFG